MSTVKISHLNFRKYDSYTLTKLWFYYIFICSLQMFIALVGVYMGLATTHTLYHLVEISFLLLSFVLVPLLIKELELGWVGLG